jgi:signal peptidase
VVVTHRVTRLRVSAGFVRFVTKGDANTSVERWQVAADGTIGRVKYRMWKLGYVLDWLDGAMVRIGLVVVPVVLLGVSELVRIWRPRREERPHARPA